MLKMAARNFLPNGSCSLFQFLLHNQFAIRIHSPLVKSFLPPSIAELSVLTEACNAKMKTLLVSRLPLFENNPHTSDSFTIVLHL